MREFESLLQSVLEHPLDDHAKLVFADYLEEHDDPRAELIRLQLELCDLPEYSARYATLKKKERKLFREHGAFGSAPSVGKVLSYHGGFVNGLQITIPRFRALHEEIFANAPITDVTLTGSFAGLPKLASYEGLRQIRRLNLRVPQCTDEKILPLLLSPHLTELRELRIGSYVGPPSYIRKYVAETHSTKLEKIRTVAYYPLSLVDLASGNPDLRFKDVDVVAEDDGILAREVAALVSTPVFSELESLTVLRMNDKMLSRIGQAACMRTVRRLTILQSRARSFQLRPPELKELRLRMQRRTPDLMSDVLQHCDQLAVLNMSSCFLSDDDAELLAASPLLSKLRRLDLSENGISLVGAQAIGRSPHRKRGLKVRLLSRSLNAEDRRQLQQEFGRSFGEF